jgi:hypothetical protein
MSGNATQLHDYVAPSWSWASLDFSTVGCHLYHESGSDIRHNIWRLARVLSIDVSYFGTEEFGGAASARMSIRGRCIGIEHWHKSEKGFNCHLDVGRSDTSSQGLESLPLDALFMQIICFEQGFVEVKVDHWSRKRVFKALILQPVNEIESEYQRIGVADISLERGQGWSPLTLTGL